MPTQERRKASRVPARELDVVVRGAHKRLEAKDISIEGVGLIGSIPDTEPGITEHVDLVVGARPLARDVAARVVYVGRSSVGLAFVNLDPATADELERLMTKRERSIDLDYFESRYAKTPDLLVRLVNLFTQDSSSKRDQIREAMATEDYKRASAVAHSLAGSAATLGALKLRQSALQLEQQLKSGNIEEARLYIQDIEEEVEQANAELAEYMDKYSKS
ncbi:Hpt domain-containing protein [Desulfocurvibacter africanus]|uniref:Hpt domain protein n=1 Tax=Desulfocurvibacter africanus subsp. africanus str. Walvis Bay TaxID=690850 RepID=F3YVM0_DESAF|nr:Hpt domain-containing protein [Desulfocurvibacter africanus]EGJ48756.1 Hpt domain protein [Desulfocurvibacter africanus subsp. africanus str. Walvis Bay]